MAITILPEQREHPFSTAIRGGMAAYMAAKRVKREDEELDIRRSQLAETLRANKVKESLELSQEKRQEEIHTSNQIKDSLAYLGKLLNRVPFSQQASVRKLMGGVRSKWFESQGLPVSDDLAQTFRVTSDIQNKVHDWYIDRWESFNDAFQKKALPDLELMMEGQIPTTSVITPTDADYIGHKAREIRKEESEIGYKIGETKPSGYWAKLAKKDVNAFTEKDLAQGYKAYLNTYLTKEISPENIAMISALSKRDSALASSFLSALTSGKKLTYAQYRAHFPTVALGLGAVIGGGPSGAPSTVGTSLETPPGSPPRRYLILKAE